MLQMGHFQIGKSVVNIDATITGTVISTIWEIISSAQKTVNMENTFSFKIHRELFMPYLLMRDMWKCSIIYQTLFN